MDARDLKAGLARWAEAMMAAKDELNELDGRLGDGDLGATLDKCARNVEAGLAGMPDSLEQVFRSSAQACARASGSSFGTLLAVAFLDAARRAAPLRALEVADVAELLSGTVQALSSRGGASLGDKTMLDSIQAIADALRGLDDEGQAARAACAAAARALDEFREKPSRTGRARMFSEKSVGMDDPGMVAILRMAESLPASGGATC